MKKQEFKNMKRALGTSRTSLNIWIQDIWIIGVPEGEEQDQEVENLFEQIMKENIPNVAKEIDLREVQEAQRIPQKLDPRRNTPTHIIIKLPKIKDKERIVKGDSYLQRSSHKIIS